MHSPYYGFMLMPRRLDGCEMFAPFDALRDESVDAMTVSANFFLST